MSHLVPTSRSYDREGATAVMGTLAFPTYPWRADRLIPQLTRHNYLP
jgi:hypothetical protein